MKTRTFTSIFVLIFAGSLALSAHAVLPAYLTIEEIPGESQRDGQEGAIEIRGYEWGGATAAAQAGKGRTRMRAQVDALYFFKPEDVSSVYLTQAFDRGLIIESATLEILNSDGTPKFIYEFRNLNFIEFSSSLEEGESEISESWGFDFEAAKIVYFQQDDRGGVTEHIVEIGGSSY